MPRQSRGNTRPRHSHGLGKRGKAGERAPLDGGKGANSASGDPSSNRPSVWVLTKVLTKVL